MENPWTISKSKVDMMGDESKILGDGYFSYVNYKVDTMVDLHSVNFRKCHTCFFLLLLLEFFWQKLRSPTSIYLVIYIRKSAISQNFKLISHRIYL
eukprot:SAG22_NODE_569_length_9023_cov_14.241820_6_plen_96_part_00